MHPSKTLISVIRTSPFPYGATYVSGLDDGDVVPLVLQVERRLETRHPRPHHHRRLPSIPPHTRLQTSIPPHPPSDQGIFVEGQLQPLHPSDNL